jgi:hypothetical protein
MVTLDEVEKMKVADLRATLTELGLPTSGVKAELQARIREHIEGQGAGGSAYVLKGGQGACILFFFPIAFG